VRCTTRRKKQHLGDPARLRALRKNLKANGEKEGGLRADLLAREKTRRKRTREQGLKPQHEDQIHMPIPAY